MFDWFKKKPSGPDFSTIDSQAKAQAAAADGTLVPLLLRPQEFGGVPGGPNVVFVPAWAAEQKQRIDTGTILPLAQQGTITRYAAEPAYKGNSFVPSSIKVHAHDPGEFTATIEIW